MAHSCHNVVRIRALCMAFLLLSVTFPFRHPACIDTIKSQRNVMVTARLRLAGLQFETTSSRVDLLEYVDVLAVVQLGVDEKHSWRTEVVLMDGMETGM